jgi:tellurite resistance protein TehA-like permease
LSRAGLPPEVFAVVMATGIVSTAAADHQYRWISAGLVVAAEVVFAGLVVTAVALGVAQRRNPFGDFRSVDVTLLLFTFVAACAVLGARLASCVAVLWTLGGIALAGWLVLAALTARNMASASLFALRDKAHGAWELASVATSGLAIVAALLSWHGTRELLWVSAAFWLVGIVVYGVMTWLIVWHLMASRWDPDGFGPDSWILMGALAIATLAGDELHHAAVAAGWSRGLIGAVALTTVVTWVAASLWIPPLVYFGLRRVSRRAGALRYAVAWWALVFPLGMYASATHSMAVETGAASLRTVSLVFFWVALTAWVICGVSAALSAAQTPQIAD